MIMKKICYFLRYYLFLNRNSYHVLAYYEGEYIGCGRIRNDKEIWRIGSVAVLKEKRGKNVGKKMIKEMENKIEKLSGVYF
jgi:N-acetylglutamate synthase-like GNAT family acetyltransferase